MLLIEALPAQIEQGRKSELPIENISLDSKTEELVIRVANKVLELYNATNKLEGLWKKACVLAALEAVWKKNNSKDHD
ncbi:MAG: hypothetical protein L7U87_03820 [Chlamydiales bacterium]|nr:hypothetical protein [Chlamydiales bacterium]